MNDPTELPQALPDDSVSDGPQEGTPIIQLPEQFAAAPAIELKMRHVAAFGGLALVYSLMLIVGGELRGFAVTGLNVIPFVILVVLAYAAQSKMGWRKALTLGYWIILTGASALLSLLLTIGALAVSSLGTLDPASLQSMRGRFPSPEDAVRIVAALLALIVAGLLSLGCFLPAVRRQVAKVLHIHADSFVHATALATAVGTTLISFIPLLAVNQPPLLPLLRLSDAARLPDSSEQLRLTLYSLVWSVPAAFLAVGFPLQRSFREARQRLALVRPTRHQFLFAVLAIAALLFVMGRLSDGIETLWNARGWQVTDSKSLDLLFGFASSPGAAVVVGLTAGLGEELVFRGVLQPRLGILLPALMFTAVHAFQYDFDALLQVFVLGVVLGLVRRRTNTTTCVLIHGSYDFVLFLAMKQS